MVDFFTSQVFLTVAGCWLSAKIIKTILRFRAGSKLKDIFDAGGFPSEHTSIVMGIFFVTAFETNWDPVISTITFFIAALFIYDATHIRYQSELHAKILNQLTEAKKLLKMPLENSLGRTYFEVLGGALVALIVSLISYYL